MPLTRAQTQTCKPHINAYLENRKMEIGKNMFDKINREKVGLVEVKVQVFQPQFIQYEHQWGSKHFNLGVRTHLHKRTDLSIKSQVSTFVKTAFAHTVELSSNVDITVFEKDNELLAWVMFHS